MRTPARDPRLRRLRRENHQVQASLGDLAKPRLKIQKARAGVQLSGEHLWGRAQHGGRGSRVVIGKLALWFHALVTTLPAAENLERSVVHTSPHRWPARAPLSTPAPFGSREHLLSHVRLYVPPLPHCFLVLENMTPDCWKSMTTLEKILFLFSIEKILKHSPQKQAS